MADKQTVELDQWMIENLSGEQIEQLNQLLIKAELKGFLTGYDCHDYPRLREYKANLEKQLGEKS